MSEVILRCSVPVYVHVTDGKVTKVIVADNNLDLDGAYLDSIDGKQPPVSNMFEPRHNDSYEEVLERAIKQAQEATDWPAWEFDTNDMQEQTVSARQKYREFPVNPEMTEHVRIPVNRQGEPLRDSTEWKTMITNAVAKAPDARSPAERSAVRREVIDAVNAEQRTHTQQLALNDAILDRVAVDLDNGHELELLVLPEMILQAQTWRPGVVHPGNDFLGEVIAYAINEGRCSADTIPMDEDDKPVSWRVRDPEILRKHGLIDR